MKATLPITCGRARRADYPRRKNLVVGGDAHTCARLADNTLRCWGYNGFGRIGVIGNTTSPTLVPDLSVTEVAAAAAHTCARLTDGSLRCWGRNTSGALGDGTTENRPTPTPVL